MKAQHKAVGLLVVSLGLVGCTLLGGEGGSVGENGRVNKKVRNISLIRGMPEERATLLRAKHEIIRRCMKSQDFKYPIPSMPNEPKERKALKIFRGDDVAERRKYGYGVITENPDAITKKPQEIGNHIQSLSPQRRQAYTKALGGGTQQKNIRVKLPDGRSVGMLSGGCQLQAQKKLYGENLKRWTMAQSVRSNLMANVQTQIRNDPKVAQRSKKWSQCMADKGYHYKSPPKAAGAVTRKIESSSKSNSELREWEIQVAVADAKCNRKVGWSKLLRQLREEYAVQVKKKYEPQILTFLKLRDEALKRARRVLGTS